MCGGFFFPIFFLKILDFVFLSFQFLKSFLKGRGGSGFFIASVESAELGHSELNVFGNVLLSGMLIVSSFFFFIFFYVLRVGESRLSRTAKHQKLLREVLCTSRFFFY